MFRSLTTSRSKRRCVQLLCVLAGWPVLSLTTNARAEAGQEQAATAWEAAPESAGAPAQHRSATPRGYRVINLFSGGYNQVSGFNATDQIAVSFYPGNFEPDRVIFYDGKSLQDIGILGGSSMHVFGINNAGELAGWGGTGGDMTVHPYKWSARDGLRDLVGPADLFPQASFSGAWQPINERGEVAGDYSTGGTSQAAVWGAGGAVRFLDGPRADQYQASIADSINNTGVAGGRGFRLPDLTRQAFVWTRKTGFVDASPAGAAFSDVMGLNDDGFVSGNAGDATGKLFAFSWTRKAGARRLDKGGFAESIIRSHPLLSNGHIAGSLRSGGIDHAAVWIGGAPDGLVDIGTFGGPNSVATAVNNRAQVVGVADYTPTSRTSFIWTRKDGKVDLNKRLRHAPPGLIVYAPYAISERGTIFADTSAGFVLLKPEEDCAGLQTPTVGAIDGVDMVEVGAVFDVSVGFAAPLVGAGSASESSSASAAGHEVKWSFGDGQQSQPGSVPESDGAGQAGASHRYTAPGVYTVSAQVNDRSGPGPTVSRTIVAYERAAGSVAGNGWFASPAGADRTRWLQGDRAHFTFAASSVDGKPAALHFRVGTLNFRSDAATAVRADGGAARLDGIGKLNGASNYRFSLRASAGQAPAMIGLKIWHTDPVTNAEVIDYDNQGSGAGSVVPAAQGQIVLH